MERVRGYQALSRTLEKPVVTIGNFDGVHLGHRHILSLTIEKARARGGTAVAYTFRPHPQVALRPEANVQLLSTYDEKLELIGEAGIDLVIEEPFSRGFSTTTPEEFFNEALIRRLGAQEIVVGYDFAFGKGRQGHLDALDALCRQAGVALTVVPPQRVDGEVCSSSRIRQHLLAGEIEAANRLLGREFSYRGIVEKGEGRGRKLGVPTANIKPENKLVLPYGVYATWSVTRPPDGAEGRRFASVTNIGVRPTFHEKALPAMVETHLLDQSLDLYGSVLEVRFVRRLREERKFPGIDALKEQIARDMELTRAILK